MRREGADPKIVGHFFKAVLQAVVQAVLLFGAETWVLIPQIERALCSFQHRVARRLARNQSRRRVVGIWDYPPLKAEMSKIRLWGDWGLFHEEA